MSNLCDFLYGRFYQLVADKSSFYQGPGRRHRVCSYLNSKSKEEMIIEAREIANNYLNKKGQKKTSGWCHFNQEIPAENQNDFYFGRCVQFVMNSNNQLLYDDLILNRTNTINKAIEMKTLQIYPKKGQTFDTHKICGYESNCTWSYGEKRCSCYNMRFYLEVYPAESIDDVELEAYPSKY